jgi:ribosome-binding protein aMBF1 (putative translation factor)
MLEPRPPSVAGKSSPAAPGAAAPGRADVPDGQPAAPAAEPERPDQLAADVARAVRELRAGAGLSERAAARLLGTSQTQLRRMEDPRYLPSLRSLARLAAAYGHRLRIAFEAKDRQLARAAKPQPAHPRPAPRAKRPPAAKAARSGGRSRRRS